MSHQTREWHGDNNSFPFLSPHPKICPILTLFLPSPLHLSPFQHQSFASHYHCRHGISSCKSSITWFQLSLHYCGNYRGNPMVFITMPLCHTVQYRLTMTIVNSWCSGRKFNMSYTSDTIQYISDVWSEWWLSRISSAVWYILALTLMESIFDWLVYSEDWHTVWIWDLFHCHTPTLPPSLQLRDSHSEFCRHLKTYLVKLAVSHTCLVVSLLTF